MPRGPNIGVVLAPQQLDRRHWWHLVRGWAQWPVMCRVSLYLAYVILTGVRTVGIPSLIAMLGAAWVLPYGSRSTADETLMFCGITKLCIVTCWGCESGLTEGAWDEDGGGLVTSPSALSVSMSAARCLILTCNIYKEGREIYLAVLSLWCRAGYSTCLSRELLRRKQDTPP